MNTKKYFLLILSLLMLVGFSTRLVIDVSQRDASVHFKFAHVNNLGPSAERAEVNTLLVVQKAPKGWDYQHPLWEIRLEPGSALPVEEIEYGRASAGFREVKNASVLVKGQTYRVAATGPGSSGFADFTVSARVPLN